MENKSASLLVMSLGKALNEMPPAFMWNTDGPDISEMETLKRVRMPHPKYSNAIHFLMNGG